ncbi:hypothetical protein L7F22_064837 [Adiantum nelumboides]|nr:hypothetical protein [Adiantum nelumboides]
MKLFNVGSDAFRQRNDALRLRDDAIRSRDEVSLLKDVAMHARNSGRSDVETATRLLVAAADSIAAKASSYKSFADNRPRSSLHTGIAAVAYGFTNRAEEIVDELLRHLDMASKDRDTIRQQMEQRHNRFVIEVSELETSIQMLKGNLMDQGAELAKWQALATENEQTYSEAEELLLKKLTLAEQENHAMTNALQLKESLLASVEVSIKHLSRLLFQTNETVANHAIAFFPTEILLDKIPPVSPSKSLPAAANFDLKSSIFKCNTLRLDLQKFRRLACITSMHSSNIIKLLQFSVQETVHFPSLLF